MTPSIYTVASGVPFLKVLARGLLARHKSEADPFALAAVTVYLPTRRAVRGLEEAFLAELSSSRNAALLLPRMRPLGDVSEEDLALEEPLDDPQADVSIPPAMPALRRRVLLTALVRRAKHISFGDGLAWAKSLERFLDEMMIEEIELSQVDKIIPASLAAHFQSSQAFLSIIAVEWPKVLAAEGFIDAAQRRRLLMDREAARLAAAPPAPVYVAGSTGSIPATARLMATVAALPQGAIVLPGLDRSLDEAAWNSIKETHPQNGLKQLLARLHVAREDITDWPYAEDIVSHASRRRLIAEALRPAPTTETWASALSDIPVAEALVGLKVIAARDQSEEARIIALAMREALAIEGKSAALVTPDRTLARRVAAELGRWGLTVDDSAGTPLAQSIPVTLMRLLLATVESELAPIPLLSLVKHGSVLLGNDAFSLSRARGALERLALRGPRPAPGIAGLRQRLAEPREERRDDSEEDRARRAERLARACDLVDRLELALAPLERLRVEGTASAAEWAMALASCAEELVKPKSLWIGDAGEMASVLREIGQAALPEPVSLAEFGELFSTALEGRAIRPRAPAHPRLFIWGPLEARLQSADLVILGGLNEGIWPARVEEGPWANRVIRKSIELSQPERRLGLSAHDFQELAAAKEVLLTRSRKVDGTPVLPSRWIMRLENFLSGRKEVKGLTSPPYASWARMLDEPRVFAPADRPQPRPNPLVRPRNFNVTDIRTLRRDPYAIYARRVLGLRVLDAVDMEISHRERGNVFHAILEAFAREVPDRLPADAMATLLRVGGEHLSRLGLGDEQRSIWRSRFEKMARDFLEWESAARAGACPVAIEAMGETTFEALQPIVLKGRIDRIDKDRATGAFTIIDYKTGSVPSVKQMEVMLEPQLPLCGVLVRRGGVGEIAPAEISALLYLQVGGKSDKFEKVRYDQRVAELIDKTEAGLTSLFARYDLPDTPYWSKAIPFTTREPGDYDLLARVAEWRVEGDREE